MADEHELKAWGSPEGVACIRVSSSAYYAVQDPERGAAEETPWLVVLHGWGQNSPSFLRRFSALKDSGILVVAPQGPHQFYLDMETRKVGFSWLTSYDRQRAVPDLVEMLDGVLDAVRGHSGVRTRPVILGFSQGVSIAYRYALRGKAPVAGVIACGGDLPPDVAEALVQGPRLPVLLVHGRDDSVVPFQKGEAARDALVALGCPVETCYFDGGHEITPTAVAEIRDWVLRHSSASL